jgi:hypothetical protein
MNTNCLEIPEVTVVGPRLKEHAVLPGHLVSFSKRQEWALWRTICLRGAGFPAAKVLKLAAPESAAAADQLLDAEERVGQLRGKALTALQHDLRNAEAGDVPQLEKLIQRLRKKKALPPAPKISNDSTRVVGEFSDAWTGLEVKREAFRKAYETSVATVSGALQEIAREGRFREAVTWQNRQAIRTGLDALLREAPRAATRGSKQRQHEELVANYLQRYCVKNDTIGFFGPVGWAQFVSQKENFIFQPGTNLLTARQVYFESWCIDALARKLSENDDLRPWIAPRLLPFIRLEGTRLYLLSQQSINVPLQQAAVLHLCNGVRMARQIAVLVMRVPAAAFKSEAEVYGVLKQLSGMGLIEWNLEIPVGIHGEQKLRQQIMRVNDERLRESSLALLDEMEQPRRDVEAAAGDAEALDLALMHLNETFTRLTGSATTRFSGKTYAGRTLVYEDCRRSIEVRVGPAFLKTLKPLALLLTSARWLSSELISASSKKFKQYYHELVELRGSPVVDCTDLWLRAQPLLLNKLDLGVVDNFQKRWSEVLALPSGHRRVEYTSEYLLPRVLSAFETGKPDLGGARYHSPDLMIAATSVEAIQRDDYSLVLGEMHLAANTLGAALFVGQHPASEELHQAVASDCPQQRLMPVPPKSLQGLTTRTALGLISRNDLLLEFAEDSCGVPPSRSVSISSLVVEEKGGQLVVRTRDGSKQFDIVGAFSEAIFHVATDFFKILKAGTHTPRITIDRLVVCREAWTFAAGEIPFASEKDGTERFLLARRWARAHGLPRFVFTKVPVEVKPFYVDFNSPVYVDILAKMVRRTLEHNSANARISVSEMLPDAEHTWLPDAEGRRYTSELRVVALDLAQWAHASSGSALTAAG